MTRIIATRRCSTGTRIYPCTDYRISYYCYIRYMDARYTVMSCLHITVTHVCHVYISLLHMHVWFLYSCHMDPRSYYMYYCSMLSPYSCYMIVSRYWYCIPVTGYMSCWYAICGIPHLLFPFPVIVFGAINRAHVMLSCYMYHILYLFLIYCIVKDNKDNLGMGETWRLTRSCRVDVWIHCLSHCRGRGSAGYRLL